ncbi:Lysine/ornithine decarboxylase [Methyloligella halotolerans]|uniref:Lysine/ornithine decarboxylase n=1 Tax=Methyloligella halotolerans TaxID=1177755 RepID=A0A1E2RX40_9HYPH|nr:type III PLP-dependent enzyme [Methyloligella halotolerans]ODA66784.1 Lysine/ornithine decarboxylase [Methyloligella halotolerans]
MDREMDRYASAAALLREYAPERPVRCMRLHAARRAAEWMLANFPGKVLYAVKANNSSRIQAALYDAGVRCFDVTSLSEIEAYAPLPGAELYLMHPVKSRALIVRAYHEFGVRRFSLDTESELAKIVEETGRRKDIHLHVRLAVPNQDSVMPLDRKFGASPNDAVHLLRLARQAAEHVGLSFHVGSQALAPESYGRALQLASDVIAEAGVPVDSIDVGGGFPARHPFADPPHLSVYMDTLREAVARLGLEDCTLLSEPGRALVAESESLLVKVLSRRGDSLYINDGIYGCLFEGAKIYGGLAFPARGLRDGYELGGACQDFQLWGTSCDSIDYMPGPFRLPADIAEGDYIELGQLGAYGRVSASRFNGYGLYDEVLLEDDPMMSMYAPEAFGVAANY